MCLVHGGAAICIFSSSVYSYFCGKKPSDIVVEHDEILVLGGTRFFYFGSIPSTFILSIDGTEYGSKYMLIYFQDDYIFIDKMNLSD